MSSSLWDKGYEFYLNEIKDFFGVDLIKEMDIFKSEIEQKEVIKEVLAETKPLSADE